MSHWHPMGLLAGLYGDLRFASTFLVSMKPLPCYRTTPPGLWFVLEKSGLEGFQLTRFEEPIDNDSGGPCDCRNHIFLIVTVCTVLAIKCELKIVDLGRSCELRRCVGSSQLWHICALHRHLRHLLSSPHPQLSSLAFPVPFIYQ